MTMTDPRTAGELEGVYAAVCDPRAEIFGTGAPFVRGWSVARAASCGLAAELERAGLAGEVGGLRADVSVSGQGLVCIGVLHPDAVRALAVLLARGLCAELDDAHAS